MNRKQKVLVAVVSGVCISLVVSTVIASSLAAHAPLFTVRMEQASSKMNFLPTQVNTFTYVAENRYTLNYDIAGCDRIRGEPTTGRTCEGTCYDPTCPLTCWSTCDDPTCGDTCPDTCSLTCYTCEKTCDTCPYTCIGC